MSFVYLPSGPDGTKVGLDDWLANGNDIATLPQLARLDPLPPPGEPRRPVRPNLPPQDGAQVLRDVSAFLASYVVFRDEHDLVATVLWGGHAHLVEVFDSTPRLAALSPEPASGKTRLLEVMALLVPNPMEAVNATPAALFRAVSDQDNRPTVLFDEIDTIFGSKAAPHEELRGLLNAGHRKGKKAYRCVGEGTAQEVREFPAYAAVALAGLGGLPDTLLSRCVILRMRRRRHDEPVRPYRAREGEAVGHALRDRLAVWAEQVGADAAGHLPAMPDGVSDRPADVWEPLLIVADLAGGDWPERARLACATIVKRAEDDLLEASLGVRLLRDLRGIFATADNPEFILSVDLVASLKAVEDGPWGDLRGQPVTDRDLSHLLRPYGVRSRRRRWPAHAEPRWGYLIAELTDPWARYLPPLAQEPEQPEQPEQSRSKP